MSDTETKKSSGGGGVGCSLWLAGWLFMLGFTGFLASLPSMSFWTTVQYLFVTYCGWPYFLGMYLAK